MPPTCRACASMSPATRSTGAGGTPARADAAARVMRTPLVSIPTPPADLLVRGARVLDPRAGIDAEADVLVRRGRIAEVGPSGTLPAAGAEVVDAAGRTLAPAFVDPHVHLRTPGQEHKEDLETGTRAAAAGGVCALIALPNTDPVPHDP